MKNSKRRASRGIPRPTQRLEVVSVELPAHEAVSLPMLVASVFTKLRLTQRVRVLRRLLMPVGPLALAVVGGGVFVKFVTEAHWPRMSISLADAARVTASQVFELVRYVEQSNPQALQQVVVVLSRDAPTVATLGASAAVVLMRHLSNRRTSRAKLHR
jgi:hypothetical protein